MRYKTYNATMKEKYGEKVYKLPINLPISCPNRDGNCGRGGCIFCGEVATGFESLDAKLSVIDQLEENAAYISKKYNANKFIAYFQNFSNTYMPIAMFEKLIEEACQLDQLVGIAVSTRPDCIHDAYLDVLSKVSEKYNLDIYIELGLQSINPYTLEMINRGHNISEFISAAMRVKRYTFDLTVHLIGNLPWDRKIDVVEAGRLLSVLQVDQVKIHSLYVLKNTKLGEMYLNNEFSMPSVEDYVIRVGEFLRVIHPDMIVQRLVGRAPKEETIFCNWDMSWWKIKDMIDAYIEEHDIVQGDRYHDLHGRAVKDLI